MNSPTKSSRQGIRKRPLRSGLPAEERRRAELFAISDFDDGLLAASPGGGGPGTGKTGEAVAAGSLAQEILTQT